MRTIGYLLFFVCLVAYFKVSHSQNDETHRESVVPLYQLLTRHRRNATDELQPETTSHHPRRHHHYRGGFQGYHRHPPPPRHFDPHHPPPPPGPYPPPPPPYQGCGCYKTEDNATTSSPASSTSWGPEIQELDDNEATIVPEPLIVAV